MVTFPRWPTEMPSRPDLKRRDQEEDIIVEFL
jgi:hypothetical protein